jgi:hypothetical protein
MKNSLWLYALAARFKVTFAISLALFPATLRAQTQYVYVNDNNFAAGGNTVYKFKHSGNSLTVPAAYPSFGTSVLHSTALKDQHIYNGTGVTCLYISEPLPTSTTVHPNGDIALFTVNTSSGALTYVTSYDTPTGIGSYWGIGLAAGVKLSVPILYAGYSTTGSSTIISWGINSHTCTLTYLHQTTVTALNGGNIGGMAETLGGTYLVVTYVDGSIQSFSTPSSGVLTPNCPTATNSTGFLTQGSFPSGVDITEDSKYAVFGDRSGPYPYGPTELETIKIPITCGFTTKDFGGAAAASGTNLGSFSNSENLWISPNGKFIYVTSDGPFPQKGVTTVAYNETLDTMSLATGCLPPYSNPTLLAQLGTNFFSPRGIQTSATTGNGTYLYIAEYYGPEPPSSVGLVSVNSAGCTEEETGSPFSDPDGIGGASQISAYPARPF